MSVYGKYHKCEQKIGMYAVSALRRLEDDDDHA